MRQFALAVLLSAPVWATTSLGTPLPDTTNSPFEFDYTTWGWYASTVVLSTTIWAPLSYNDNYSLRTTGTFWDIVKVTSPTEPAYTCSSRFLMSGSTSMTCTSGFPCTTALLYSSLGAAEALTQFECGSTGRTIYRVSPTSGVITTTSSSSPVTASPTASPVSPTTPAQTQSEASSLATSAPSQGTDKTKVVGIIVGGVIGGIVALGAIIITIILLLRKKRKDSKQEVKAEVSGLEKAELPGSTTEQGMDLDEKAMMSEAYNADASPAYVSPPAELDSAHVSEMAGRT